MFRLLKLKPPHGWNAVAWELAIVTLGVLIALGAQQIVEDLHWRGEMREFRKAVRAEISWNLATYPYRTEQNRCTKARLDELQRWLDSWRAGRPLKLIAPIAAPQALIVRTTVWDSRDPETFSRIPLTEKLDYGGLYTEFANAEGHRLDEPDPGPDAPAGAHHARPAAPPPDHRQFGPFYQARRRYRHPARA